MPISFHPRMGQIFVADFSDLEEPEMTKKRPVIVVSPRLPHRSKLVAVVPISLTAPQRDVWYVYRLSRNYHPSEASDLPCWAKADMVMTIAVRRLEGFKTGRRTWLYPNLSADDLTGVRLAMIIGLGLDRLKIA